MIGLLLEIADVLVGIVAPVFCGHFESTMWRDPSSKYFGELIVPNALSTEALRKPWIVRTLRRERVLEERLKDLRPITARNSRAGPYRMKETRAADLESGDSQRLPDNRKSSREPSCARFCSADELAWSSHV